MSYILALSGFAGFAGFTGSWTGTRVLGSGFWVFGSGFWVLGSGFWVPGSGFWFLVSGFWFPGSGFRDKNSSKSLKATKRHAPSKNKLEHRAESENRTAA